MKTPKPITPANLYAYKGTVLSIHDADTLRVGLSLGFSVSYEVDVRLLGCNGIELAAPGGVESRDHLAAVLPIGTTVLLKTVRPDKFGGRYDAQITLPDGTDLVSGLIAAGFAASWNGLGPKPVPAWPIPAKTS